MARFKFYNRSTNTLVIDGVAVKGIADGDAIRIRELGDKSSVKKGLDRAETSISNDGTAELEIDLLSTSPYIATVNNQDRRQQEGSGRLMDASVRTGVNESEKLQGLALKRKGDLSTGGSSGQNKTVIYTVERWIGDETQ